MQPKFVTLAETRLVGMKTIMSFAHNQTAALWRAFMPVRNKIPNPVNNHLYAAEVYEQGFFAPFNPLKTFEKWALVAVSDFSNVPDELETLIFPEGYYAVFLHKGPASDGPKTYDFIFREWLPHSGFTLDERPHFALMDERYKHDADDSEEEIWIPIRQNS